MSLAQAVNVATTKYGVLTIFSYQELSAVTLSWSTLNSDGEFMPVMLNPNTTIYDSGYTYIFRDQDVFHMYLAQVTNVATANYGMLTAPFNQELSTATL